MISIVFSVAVEIENRWQMFYYCYLHDYWCDHEINFSLNKCSRKSQNQSFQHVHQIYLYSFITNCLKKIESFWKSAAMRPGFDLAVHV
jgi:hypothetical protein